MAAQTGKPQSTKTWPNNIETNGGRTGYSQLKLAVRISRHSLYRERSQLWDQWEEKGRQLQAGWGWRWRESLVGVGIGVRSWAGSREKLGKRRTSRVRVEIRGERWKPSDGIFCWPTATVTRKWWRYVMAQQGDRGPWPTPNENNFRFDIIKHKQMITIMVIILTTLYWLPGGDSLLTYAILLSLTHRHTCRRKQDSHLQHRPWRWGHYARTTEFLNFSYAVWFWCHPKIFSGAIWPLVWKISGGVSVKVQVSICIW